MRKQGLGADLDQLRLLAAKPANRDLPLGACAPWLRDKWRDLAPDTVTLGQLADQLKGKSSCGNCGGDGWCWDYEGGDTRYSCERCDGTGLMGGVKHDA